MGSARRTRSRFTLIRETGGDPLRFLPSYPGLLRSLPELTAAERGRGVLVGEADRDGILRRVPLFVVAEGHLVPSMTLEALRVASGAGSLGIITRRYGVQGALLGDLFIPSDWRGARLSVLYPVA